VGGALLAFLGPLATEVLFGAPVRATAATCMFYGVSFLFISASSPLMRNLLIPFGGQRLILVWTAISAVLGLGVMIAAGVNQWTDGIAFGMALSEALLFAAVFVPGMKRLRNFPESAGEPVHAAGS
jgi:PST family polysaccharide transporter